MASVAHPSIPMSDQRAINVAARLKRDISIHRVAQTLADAAAARAGAELVGLSQMKAEDRDWYKTARSLVEIYETCMGIAPIPAVAEAKPETTYPVSTRMLIERQRGRTAAIERGHDMGSYSLEDQLEQVAHCRTCGRSVVIDLTHTPSFFGAAVTEGCLTEARKDGE